MRAIVVVALLAAPLLAWILTADRMVSGVAVFGTYHERWFLFNIALSALCLPLAYLLMRRAGRRAYVGWVTVGVVSAVIVMLLELTAMVGWVDYRAVLLGKVRNPLPDFEVRRSGTPHERWRGPFEPDLVRRMGLSARAQPFSFALDRYGLRNPATPGDAVYYVVGDSIVFGAPVDIEETLTQRIGARSGATARAVAEVGSAPEESLQRLVSTGLPVAGRTIIHVVFGGNDLHDSERWNVWCRRPFRSDWPYSGFLSAGLAGLKWAATGTVDQQWGIVEAGGKRVRIYFLYEAKRSDEWLSEWPQMRRGLSTRIAGFQDRGANYLMVFVPFKLNVFHPYVLWPDDTRLANPKTAESRFAEYLADFSREQGVVFVDATGELRKCLERGELPYYPLDTHLTPCGHEAVAKAVVPHL